MNYALVLGLLSIFAAASLALVPPAPAIAPVAAAAPPPPPPPATLSQDFEQIALLIPTGPLNKLVIRYLLNDAEFQGVMRVINSHDAYIVRMRLLSQPEVIAFQSWVRTQLMLSGGSFEFEESEEILSLFRPTPYWSVYGWQGFFNEFLAYYPEAMIRATIDMKLMQNGSFAQFWARLKALRPVYERVLLFPEAQRIITQLQTHGVDTNQLDTFIRTQLDWFNVTGPAVSGGGGGGLGSAAGAIPAPPTPIKS